MAKINHDQALAAVAAGATLAEVARMSGVHPSTVTKWARKMGVMSQAKGRPPGRPKGSMSDQERKASSERLSRLMSDPSFRATHGLDASNAKTWIIKSPTGSVYLIRNLKAWCETNASLFAPDAWRRVYDGFRMNKGRWRGWRATKTRLRD